MSSRLQADQCRGTAKNQHQVSLSSTESEYRALMEGTREAMSITNLLRELQLISEGPTKIFCDNIGSIKLTVVRTLSFTRAPNILMFTSTLHVKKYRKDLLYTLQITTNLLISLQNL